LPGRWKPSLIPELYLLLHYGAGLLVKSWSALSRSGRLKVYATMRWEDFRRYIRDRRGAAAGGLGIGTVVVLGLLGWAFGIDPRLLIGGAEQGANRARCLPHGATAR
jgi:hypothetical protein